jgi:superfamily II DNA/RNA helicase
VLVFSCYTDTVHYVRDFIRDFYPLEVGSFTGEGGGRWDGSQWYRCGKEAITEALRKGELQVLVCNDAASEGLNLQAASAVVNYDLPWNPSRVEQRIGRADRIGQARDTVKVVNLFLEDSVDDRVYSALRRRCGLFQHFVGPMQPVLAIARDVLLGKLGEDEVEAAANEAERDDLAQETYISAEAVKVSADSPLARGDLVSALEMLDLDMPVRATCKGASWSLKLGNRRRRLGFTPKELEADPDAEAVLPESDLVADVARRLAHKGELLPLAIGTNADGPLRASVAKWLTPADVLDVQSYRQLKKLIEEWDGVRPEPSRYQQALRDAEAEAAARIRQMKAQSDEIASQAVAAQRRAARLRLLAELARFLLCLSQQADLNQTLHEHSNRRDARAEWLRQAFGLLGSVYPDWAGELHVDLQPYREGLPENKRTARLLGSELHAAMSDPRWPTAKPTG